MAKRKKRTSDKVVPHPRYGDAFIPSGWNVAEKTVRDSFWAYDNANIFASSAIPADTSRQNFSTFPRGYYVDMLKLCRDCKRNFIFFAREQQFWYEELGFYVDADCVRCAECRANDKEVKRRFQRYSENISRRDLPNESLACLADDVVFLWNHNLFQDEQTLRRIKNLANSTIPDHVVTAAINSLVMRLHSD